MADPCVREVTAPNKNTHDNQTDPDQNGNPPQPKQPLGGCSPFRSYRNLAHITRYATVVTAIATAVYAIFALGQWIAIKESNRINYTAITATQRAFLVFGQNMNPYPVKNEKGEIVEWEFQAVVENTGNTPTRNATVHANRDRWPSDIPAAFRFPDYAIGHSTPFIVGPKVKITVAPIKISVATVSDTTHCSFAKPEQIRFTDALPKTRSGKIMRRLLREIVTSNAVTGDVTTLEDLSVVTRLAAQHDED